MPVIFSNANCCSCYKPSKRPCIMCPTMSTAKCSLHLLKTQLYIVTRNTHFQYILQIYIFSDLSSNNAAVILVVFSLETPKRYWFHIRRKLTLMSSSPTLFSEKDKEKKKKRKSSSLFALSFPIHN